MDSQWCRWLQESVRYWPGWVGLQPDVVGKSDKTPGAEAILSLHEMYENLWKVWKTKRMIAWKKNLKTEY